MKKVLFINFKKGDKSSERDCSKIRDWFESNPTSLDEWDWDGELDSNWSSFCIFEADWEELTAIEEEEVNRLFNLVKETDCWDEYESYCQTKNIEMLWHNDDFVFLKNVKAKESWQCEIICDYYRSDRYNHAICVYEI